MVLINKQPKLSCHMASMPINDRRLIKPVKPYLRGGGLQNKPPMEFLDLFLQVSKSKVKFRW